MTNNSIKEKIRLAVPFYSPAIDLRDHKAVRMTRLGGRHDLLENVSVKHPMPLLDFRL